MMKHVDGSDDEEVKKMMEELEEKCSELKEVEIRNTILVIKERRSNEEIEEAREVLITVYIFHVLDQCWYGLLVFITALFLL